MKRQGGLSELDDYGGGECLNGCICMYLGLLSQEDNSLDPHLEKYLLFFLKCYLCIQLSNLYLGFYTHFVRTHKYNGNDSIDLTNFASIEFGRAMFE